MLTTAEGSSDRFEPIILQNVFFICIKATKKNNGHFFMGFAPQKVMIFSAGGLMSELRC